MADSPPLMSKVTIPSGLIKMKHETVDTKSERISQFVEDVLEVSHEYLMKVFYNYSSTIIAKVMLQKGYFPTEHGMWTRESQQAILRKKNWHHEVLPLLKEKGLYKPTERRVVTPPPEEDESQKYKIYTNNFSLAEVKAHLGQGDVDSVSRITYSFVTLGMKLVSVNVVEQNSPNPVVKTTVSTGEGKVIMWGRGSNSKAAKKLCFDELLKLLQ